MKAQQLALLGVITLVAALTIREWPEIVRYLKMKSM